MNFSKKIISLVTGIIFSIGLGASGMTQPQKIIGFLDILGDWDPALIMVMVGAILFHGITFQIITRRASPLLAEKFQIPSSTHIDKKLIVGAAIFGLGWGIGGYCPGPGLASLASGEAESFLFVTSMLVGMGVFKILQPMINRSL